MAIQIEEIFAGGVVEGEGKDRKENLLGKGIGAEYEKYFTSQGGEFMNIRKGGEEDVGMGVVRQTDKRKFTEKGGTLRYGCSRGTSTRETLKVGGGSGEPSWGRRKKVTYRGSSPEESDSNALYRKRTVSKTQKEGGKKRPNAQGGGSHGGGRQKRGLMSKEGGTILILTREEPVLRKAAGEEKEKGEKGAGGEYKKGEKVENPRKSPFARSTETVVARGYFGQRERQKKAGKNHGGKRKGL